ncbi:hypothetical protein POVWA1_052030 [Plasmodium ovale wallikeri]|uniref:Uncharacterized protein n=1 Tax=Plasmodium ovale wallikeri TaxID=864142 RepID=A0A1A8ZNR1_PLAOA|nr:hypothetical protein POVWA1_052030 [Plasmodium ovale wallikeri]
MYMAPHFRIQPLSLLPLCLRVANVTPVSRPARLILAYHGNGKHQKILAASIRNVNSGLQHDNTENSIVKQVG